MKFSRQYAEAEYRMYLRHDRPDGPYKMVCTECDDWWEVDSLLDADHDARRHAGEEAGLYGKRAEIAVTDAYGRELFRVHALPEDDGHPMFVNPRCESCDERIQGVSCGNCGHIPEKYRA